MADQALVPHQLHSNSRSDVASQVDPSDPNLSGSFWFDTGHAIAKLIRYPDLDAWTQRNPAVVDALQHIVDRAIASAYVDGAGTEASHRFLQRTLYRMNRLMLFWYDDLRYYENDRSPFLLQLRSAIEHAWQAWEVRTLSLEGLRREDVTDALRTRAARDVDAPPSAGGRFFRDHASLPGYRWLLAIGSLDGLVEASQLSRTLGGAANAVHATLTKLLLEEYGGGRLHRKHSTYFRTMLETLGMHTTPEAYFEVVPWEVLANINQSFLLSDRKRLFLRYVGGLLYTEVSVPAAFRCYLAAAQRLELPPGAMTYWELHIKEDARHGPWMLNDVALPLADRYPDDAWEIVLGYDQQRAMSARAGDATARAAYRAAELL